MSIGDLKVGISIIHNNELYEITNCEHVKLARGPAFCRVKLKNLKTGQVFERTLRDSDKVEQAFIEKRALQYLYHQGQQYHFMDLAAYEDFILSQLRISDKALWLKDGLELTGLFHGNELIDFELPASLVFTVVETEPGFKGDSVKGGVKPAKLETGLVINVPIFINNGDKIKVDTRTKDYLGRA